MRREPSRQSQPSLPTDLGDRFIALFLGALLTSLFLTRAALAWTGDPAINLPVCTFNGDQSLPAAAQDGAGGMIVVWEDLRNSGSTGVDIYAQHVLGNGTVDPLWPANGVALTRAALDQHFPVIVSDGSGGAIVAWNDSQGNSSNLGDIYAQHVRGNGTLDPGWEVDGDGVCTDPFIQGLPKITSDGAHGAYVTWDDNRTTPKKVLIQHLLDTGVDPSWTFNGTAVCTAASAQSFPVICSDKSGGAIIAWNDRRSGVHNLYAQRVSAAGVLQWPADGVPFCMAAGTELLNGVKLSAGLLYYLVAKTSADAQGNAIIPDGAGGCIITWLDNRNFGATGYDVYAQHVLATGAVDGGWTANGVPLCAATGDQTVPTVISDGAGGAIAAWKDSRTGVFAQHVSSAGVVDGPQGGLALSAAASQAVSSYPPCSVSDGAGGAFIFWSDPRDSVTRGNDVYAQHVRTTSGFSIHSLWPANGAPVSIASGNQEHVGGAVSDDAGNAMVSWHDGRNSSGGLDIYAQGGAFVASAPGAQNPSLGYALSQIEPNPIRFDTAIRFNLRERSSVALVIDDVSGREVKSLVSGELEAGTHLARWSGDDRNGKRVLSGIYFAHMIASSMKDGSHFAATRKMIVLR